MDWHRGAVQEIIEVAIALAVFGKRVEAIEIFDNLDDHDGVASLKEMCLLVSEITRTPKVGSVDVKESVADKSIEKQITYALIYTMAGDRARATKIMSGVKDSVEGIGIPDRVQTYLQSMEVLS